MYIFCIYKQIEKKWIIYHIMQIVHGGKLSWFSQFSFQLWKFSSEVFLFYNKVFLGLKWRTACQALHLACWGRILIRYHFPIQLVRWSGSYFNWSGSYLTSRGLVLLHDHCRRDNMCIALRFCTWHCKFTIVMWCQIFLWIVQATLSQKFSHE